MAAGRKDSVADDDYWTSSSASRISKKMGNLFDDSVNFDDAKNILKQSVFDDFDEEDGGAVINWDGTPGILLTIISYSLHPLLSAHSVLQPSLFLLPSFSPPLPPPVPSISIGQFLVPF